MIRAFLLAGLLSATVSCANHLGTSPGDGSNASLGDGAREMAVDGNAPDGDGDAAACTCPTGLFIDVMGDGDPLHLTSADVALVRGLPVNPSTRIAAQCLAPPIPWVWWASGEINLPYDIEACAGPGSAPPCVLLNGDAVATGSFASSYVDRTGQSFGGDASLTWPQSPQPPPPWMQALDGSFTLTLEDGRTLSGTFHTCLIASIIFA